jgi:hypothetical protein
METEIPEGAKMTPDLDCVLLTSPMSYFSQIVRLCAVEKGCNWKHFKVDHTKNEHTAPWYVKLNPKTYVPTMLVAGNKPICESMEIAKYIDRNFKGKVQLDKEITSNPLIKERYDIFMKMIDDLMVEPFTMGALNQTPITHVWVIAALKSFNPIQN